MILKRVAVVCVSFDHKNKDVKNMFKGHPKPGYVYKGLTDDYGSLKVILPSDGLEMGGIMFDSYSGKNSEYSYRFMDYSPKSVYYMTPDTLKYNSFDEIHRYLNEVSYELSSLPSIIEDFEDSSSEVRDMSLKEVVDSPEIFKSYMTSLLSFLKGQDEEILLGGIYSLEYAIEQFPGPSERPRETSIICSEINDIINSLRDDDDSVDYSRLSFLFFLLMYKLNKGQ